MANNDDQRPDDLNDFEADGDFSEFEDQRDSEALGTTLRNNPLVKLGLVAAGLIVVIGGIMLFGGEEVKAPSSAVGSASKLKETPGTEELSPVMQEAMEEYNDQRTAEAIKQGTSVLPVPIEPPKTFLNAPADTTSGEDPLQRWREMQEERLRVQREQEQMQAQNTQAQQPDPAIEQARANLAAAMSTQMTQIMAQTPKELAFMQVTSIKETDGDVNSMGVGAGAGFPPGMTMGPNGTMIPSEPLEIVIPAGSILYAQLLNEANSDVQGPIVALLAQGAFSGSRVLGTFVKKEKLLVLQFTTLVSKEGFSIPINSYAMDPDTTLVGMATEVDNRYFKRVILPAAAEFITGMGAAIAESGTTTVTVNGGLGGSTSTQDNTEIDTEQEISKGVERAFDKVGDILDEEGQATEVLVIVKAGTPLGILFMEPVTKQAIDAAKFGAGPMGGNANQQQQQQQGNPLFTMMGMNQNQQQMNNQMMGQQQYPNQYQNPYSNTGAMNSLPQSIIQGLQNQQSIQSGTQ